MTGEWSRSADAVVLSFRLPVLVVVVRCFVVDVVTAFVILLSLGLPVVAPADVAGRAGTTAAPAPDSASSDVRPIGVSESSSRIRDVSRTDRLYDFVVRVVVRSISLIVNNGYLSFD